MLSAFQHESPGEKDFRYSQQIAAKVVEKVVAVVGQDGLTDMVGNIRRIISDCSSDQQAINSELIQMFQNIDPHADIEIIRCFMHR